MVKNGANTPQKVLIITTGGTIEKTYDEGEGTLHNRETSIRRKIVERLRLPYTQIEVKSIMAKDSLDMTNEDREIVLDAIKLFAKFNNPIVVLHGTDTMQNTAELVQKLWSNVNVPVVFTGAMKPLGFEDSDAMQNVVEAIYAAKIVNPGVYISFHNRLFTVPGVRKNKTKRTFESF
jgi:L-asparaginase